MEPETKNEEVDLHTVIIRPCITYASILWWNELENKNMSTKIENIQRTAWLRTKPIAALSILLDIPALNEQVKPAALKKYCTICRWRLPQIEHRKSL